MTQPFAQVGESCSSNFTVKKFTKCVDRYHVSYVASAAAQGLVALPGAKALRVLNLVDCSVTDDAVARLRTALPTIAVSHTHTPDGLFEACCPPAACFYTPRSPLNLKA